MTTSSTEQSAWPGITWKVVVIDTFVVLVAVLNALLAFNAAGFTYWVFTMLAATGLFIRRRWPWASLALTIPGFVLNVSLFSMMIALYSVARREQRIWRLAVAAAIFFGIQSTELALLNAPGSVLTNIRTWYTSSLYSALYVLAPAALGVAVRGLKQLQKEIRHSRALQEQRSRLAAEQVLERERAVLAREMHDVVSNQVSLIAVQAGALRISSNDPLAKASAATIRNLSVTTLDELRAMIEVLRAAGGTDRGAAPQPTLDDLDDLVNTSGIHVRQNIEVDRVLPLAIQRALFRFTQEGLTNARKHATGADVDLSITLISGIVSATLTAGAPLESPLQLPSSHFGLIGLRERADLLGGTLTRTLHDDQSHTLSMTLPVTADSAHVT